MDARDHVLALTVRGQSLLELIGNASGSPRSAGSQAVLELEGIITELRRIYPPPLFKVAEPLLYPIVNPRLSDARRISGDMPGPLPSAAKELAPVVADLRSTSRRRALV